MSAARNKLIAKLQAASTEMLIDVVRKLNRDTTAEGIVVASEAANVLEGRMSDADFLELMNELESDLMAA